MTVTYTLEVSTAKLLGFAKLLFRWKGSIYRLMYKEMLLFTVLYYLVAYIYRSMLTPNYRFLFEQLALYCRTFTDLIPLTFVMSFYVALVVNRWWAQYECIPWPDKAVMKISSYIQGTDEKTRIIRRSLARYLNLISVLVFRSTSTSILKRLPTLDHMLDAGLMTVDERLAFEDTELENGNWWVPASWFSHLLMVARDEGRIADDLHVISIMDVRLIQFFHDVVGALVDFGAQEMHNFRGLCGQMFSYDWISVPLVYTQVVTLATYCFFVACLFGRQYLLNDDTSENSIGINYYIPIFTFFQFFFYMGWLKVAEELICPYGEDDDDFDLNWILDRNIELSYACVDSLHGKHPRLTKDAFWDDKPSVPYTVGTSNMRKPNKPIGSTYGLNLHTGKKTHWEDEEETPEETKPDVEDHFYLVPPLVSGLQPPSFKYSAHNKTPHVMSMTTVPGRIARRMNRLIGARRRKASAANDCSSTQSLSSNWKPKPVARDTGKAERLKRRRLSTLEYCDRRKYKNSDSASETTGRTLSFWADNSTVGDDFSRLESIDETKNRQADSQSPFQLERQDSFNTEVTASSGVRSNHSAPAVTARQSKLSLITASENEASAESLADENKAQQNDDVDSEKGDDHEGESRARSPAPLTPIAECSADASSGNTLDK